jgi:transcription termination factor 2
LGIAWHDKITNSTVLDRASIPSMFALLTQRRLRWLGHVRRMDDHRLPKDVLFGELAEGTRSVGRPLLRYKDVCKREMSFGGVDASGWEVLALDRSRWRGAVRGCAEEADGRRRQLWDRGRERRKLAAAAPQDPTQHICGNSGRDCRSRIGLYSHSRSCAPGVR